MATITTPTRATINGVPVEVTPIKMPEDLGMTTYTKENANKIVSQLKGHIGEKVILSGGGGNEANLAKLKGVEIIQDEYYVGRNRLPEDAINVHFDQEAKDIRYSRPNRYHVVATLDGLGSKDTLFTDSHWEGEKRIETKRDFMPHLGSWQIATIKPSS
jgi:hypothetical protein